MKYFHSENIKDENRLLLILHEWARQGLTLTLAGDKIKPSRPVSDDERELIQQYRDLIVGLISSMSFRTKAECRPFLKAQYKKSKEKYTKKRKFPQ